MSHRHHNPNSSIAKSEFLIYLPTQNKQTKKTNPPALGTASSNSADEKFVLLAEQAEKLGVIVYFALFLVLHI